jgi:hypothetical protein
LADEPFRSGSVIVGDKNEAVSGLLRLQNIGWGIPSGNVLAVAETRDFIKI